MAVRTTGHRAVVLIVEDDYLVADLLAEIVESAGGTPLIAYDGPQALTLARSSSPALVITDMVLPTMRGDALVVALREILGTTLPVILVSGRLEAETMRGGVTAVLPKPFRVQDLMTLLDRLIAA